MEQEIIRCEDDFLQAFRILDIEALENMIHDELIYNNPVGHVLTKEMDLDILRSGNITVESVDCIERKIQRFDDTAIVSTVIHLKGTMMKNPIDGKTRFLRTWKKFNDGWEIIAAASINLS